MQRAVKYLSTVTGLFLLYILLLVAQGYQFGDGDLIQIDPLILAMKDHSLYEQDYYIQHAVEHFPNERSFFLLFLLPFSEHLATASFILHMIFSLLLLGALFRISSLFIKNRVLLWFVIPVLFIPLYNIDLGTNELYYGIFHPSLTAKALASWGIYFWLQKKNIGAYILIALASLQHPVAGPQVFLFITLSEIILTLRNRSGWKRSFFAGVCIYLITAGAFIISLQLRFRDTGADNTLFYDIFFRFRNPHHYLPSAFPLKNWIILVPMFIAGLFIWRRQDVRIFVVFIVIITGCVCYTIAAEVLHSVSITPVQWFKATIWLEFLSLVAIVKFIEKSFAFLNNATWKKITLVTGASALLFFLFKIYPAENLHAGRSFFNFPFSKGTIPEIEISLAAKNNTPTDALFIEPCSFTDLKYYGQRSSIVDYKALTHRKSFILEWASRFEDVYDLDINTAPRGLKTPAYADEQFRKLSADYILELQQKYKLTHILTFADCNYPFEIVAENSRYKIYKLPV